MSPECENCERLPLNQISFSKIINELEGYPKDMTEDHIIRLEEITREWREQHG